MSRRVSSAIRHRAPRRGSAGNPGRTADVIRWPAEAGVRRPQPGAVIGLRGTRRPMLAPVIFKRVGHGRPYPEHGLSPREWAALPPRQVRLDELVTTKDTLQLAALLDEDSTFFGDLFAHVVEYQGELYLEDGLHRALRAALQQRTVLHARVHVMEG
jgi:Arc/MetJ family transcription regulator